MTYLIISTMKDDGWLRSRVAACAALEGIPDPAQWAVQHKWDIAIQPGWAASWESALVDAPEGFEPGKQDNVITDAMILSTVQVIIAQEDSPPEAA